MKIYEKNNWLWLEWNDSGHLKQVSRLMKLVFVLMLTLVWSVRAEVYSQEYILNLQLKQTSLSEVFNRMESQTGLRFLYNTMLIESKGKVDVEADRADIRNVLEQLLKPLKLTYVLNGEQVVVKEAVPAASLEKQVIKGKVTGEKGEALPGVTILIKGTTVGVVSDQDGRYELTLPAGTDVILVYSFVGMQPQEVKYTGQSELNITLHEEVSEMDEVVVTGIYIRKKESFTGSSITFSNRELKMVGNGNVLESLKTLDPSFAIIENNEFGSDPNHLPDIEIRGKSSVIGLTEQYGTDPNQPLFILDGFETTLSVISDLSMDRVANITILKDAAATAIYGSKAANGVVVVETRQPVAGKLRLNYDLGMTVSFADLSDYNLMNASEKLTFERLSGYYGELDDRGNILSESLEANYNNRLKEVRRGVESYWIDEPLRVAVSHKHTVFIEGGDEHMRYGAGVGYNKVQGVMKGSGRDVLNGNLRLIYRRGAFAFTNLLSVDYSYAQRETVPFYRFVRANPYHRKWNAEGKPELLLEEYSRQAGTYTGGSLISHYNPLYDLQNNNFDHTSAFGATNNFEVDWRFTGAGKLRMRLGVNKAIAKEEIFRSPFNSDFVNKDPLKKGSFEELNTQNLNLDGDISLTYGKLFGEKHLVNVVGGMRFTQNSSVSSIYEVEGFIDDEFANPAFGSSYVNDKEDEYKKTKRRTASYYLNAGYVYDERYLLDFNYRTDGSSIFGSSRHFTNTWSLGIGWNLHKEKFLKGAGMMDLLKLRFSIGNPGNQNFDDYISSRVFRYNTHHSNPFGTSVIVEALGNTALKWQKTLDRNIGVDMMFWNSRLRLNIDYFSKKTDPLLVYVGMPSSVGTTVKLTNFGKQLTEGVTLNVNYAIISKEAIRWSVNLNMRHMKSEYRDIDTGLELFNKENRSRNLIRYYNGGSPADLWAVRSCGIDPTTGREIFLKKNGHQTFVHDYDDEVVVGNTEPKIEGVFGTSFYYKGFSASVNFRYRLGGDIFMQTLYDKVENIGLGDVLYNQDKRALHNRWKSPGDRAEFKAISQTEYTPMSSRFVSVNHVLSGESISVGYETQSKKLQQWGISSLLFKAYMNDIFRISSVKNERGINYPFARSVACSLGIRF